MSVIADSRVVTERGLTYVGDLLVGDKVLGKHGHFNRLRRLVSKYHDGALLRMEALGITGDGRVWQASACFMEAGKMGYMSYAYCVSQEEWAHAERVTPKLDLRPQGVVVEHGSQALVLCLSPVALAGRVLFASYANSSEKPTRIVTAHRGPVWDLVLDGDNCFVAERFIVEGIPSCD